MKPKKTKRVNINLTAQDHKELTKIKEKYELSYSTIANILFNWYALYVSDTEYIYKNNGFESKTSIKPRTPSNQKRYTNVIKLWTRNGLRNYLFQKIEGTEEAKKKFYDKMLSGIHKEFEETIDPNWNGNKEARAITRFISKNPEYVRRLIEK